MKGYAGKIAVVDLTSGSVRVESLSEEFCRNYVGGLGFATKLLYDLTGPETRPLGPENVLIFATGPFQGASVPGSGRYVVVGKSPLTGTFGTSTAGSAWGIELKLAGFDAHAFFQVSEDLDTLLLQDLHGHRACRYAHAGLAATGSACSTPIGELLILHRICILGMTWADEVLNVEILLHVDIVTVDVVDDHSQGSAGSESVTDAGEDVHLVGLLPGRVQR
jgi:hypothetical protein